MDLVEAAILGAVLPIAAVGAAVLLVMAVHFTIKSVRASLDHEAAEELFHEEFMASVESDDDPAFFDLVCYGCGWESSEAGWSIVHDGWGVVNPEDDDHETEDCPECGRRLIAG